MCVGFDEKNTPRYASYRATNDRRVLGDCSGSDKHYSFRIADSDSGTVHLFACAIDLLSYATLEKTTGRNRRKDNLVSLAGVYLPKERIEDSTTPAALVKYLDEKPQIKKDLLHFDNDNAGRHRRNCGRRSLCGAAAAAGKRKALHSGVKPTAEGCFVLCSLYLTSLFPLGHLDRHCAGEYQQQSKGAYAGLAGSD